MFATSHTNWELNHMRTYTSTCNDGREMVAAIVDAVNEGREMYVVGTYRKLVFGIYAPGRSIDGLEFSDATEFSASVENAGGDYENATIVASVAGIELARVRIYWDEIDTVEVLR